MNLMMAAGMIICMLSMSAAAFSGASLSTNSLLWTENSENSVLRSLYDDRITIPNLELITRSEITTEVGIKDGGSAKIGQSASVNAIRQDSGLYDSMGSVSSSASGSGVDDIKSSITFQGTSEISNPWGDIGAMSKIEVDLLGLVMARPETDDYHLYTDANYYVLTNVPILIKSDKFKPIDPNSVSISMVVDDKFDEPVDYIDEDSEVHFSTNGYDISGGYDFSRTIENDEMDFSSQMSYVNCGLGDEL
jgi:hypothetical protein